MRVTMRIALPLLAMAVPAWAIRLSSRANSSVDESSTNPWCHNGHLLPSVFMLGMQKAGSSSIWKNLIDYLPLKRGCGEFGKGGECEVWGQKEPLYMKKELHFFDDDERYGKGLDFYSAHYPECTELKKSDRGLDGTPNYLNEKVAQRMAESYGDRKKDLKFLLIIRDPVQRMEAGYWHFMPGHAGGFKEFVNKTLHGAKDWKDGKGESPWEPNPYHGSLYARALKQFLKHFDGSQFTVLTLEQYAEDPDRVMSFLAERLHQKKKKKTIFKAEHRHERVHDKMDQETRQLLDEYFKDDQKEFNDLVKQHCMAMDCGSAESHM